MLEDFIIKLDGYNSKGLLPLSVDYASDLIKVTINKNMSYDEFINELKLQTDINTDLINKAFIIDNNLLKCGYKILLFNNEDVVLILSCALEISMKFSVYLNEKNINKETIFSGERRIWDNASTYKFRESLFDNEELFSEKFYIALFDGYQGNIEHKDALDLIRTLIKKIDDLSISEYIPMHIIYLIAYLARNLNVISSDDKISLSWKNNENENNVNDVKEACFNIILNDTCECVGAISFDYNFNKRKDGVYFGNVSYEIYPVFRNHGYASRALKLLKEVVKTNNVYDRDLYISVKKSNIYSKQVALNNGGKECFSGNIPESVRYVDDERSISIYRIKI